MSIADLSRANGLTAVISPTISLGQRGRDRRYARNDPNPVLGQTMRVARASQLRHAVEDMDRHARALLLPAAFP